MNRLSYIGLLLIGCMCGCDGGTITLITPKIQHAGPFTVTRSDFDYHETLAYPDGREFEFNHSSYEASLGDVGSVVEIDFTGDLHSGSFDNKVIAVKVLSHSPEYTQHHPELWPPRKGHWDKSSYLLDDGTSNICGAVEDNRSIDEGWAAYANGYSAREHIYEKYGTRAAAVKAVEKACS